MSGKIYFIKEGEALSELTETVYENEDLFQSLIVKYPEILAGEQINPQYPRKWVLISREIDIPLGEGNGRVDHLFIDQDAIPTFIEAKRSTDTRIRREVVGQMLDYAANASQFWPINDLRSAYERNILEGESSTLLDIGVINEEAFWQNADMNLRNGNVRLLFVADSIPASLQAIIEFLNKQMRDTEVLGLEIKQFVGEDGSKTLVPNLVGRTAGAIQAKRLDAKRKFANRSEFFDSVENGNVKNLYSALFAYADASKCRISMGTAGFSLSIAISPNRLFTLLFGYGASAANRQNCIVTTFGLLKGIDHGILEEYKKMVGELAYFEPTSSGNYIWHLGSDSTDEEMQYLISIAKFISNKIDEAETNKLLQ
ncbi:MAG: hypothetical protein FWG30_09740 [Eubacteriaceae bacterium]|nr:hypothetical protein [Eubacteriaceae bacterium]